MESFAVLEPAADGFRNYLRAGQKLPSGDPAGGPGLHADVTVPEMTVLIGGMRALDANAAQFRHGVLTGRPKMLANDFFVNLLDMGTEWKASASAENVYEGRDRATGEAKWTATAVDLVSARIPSSGPSRRSTRAPTPRRSSSVTSWPPGKVMNLDRFDLA